MKIMKKILCTVLVVVMCLTSAPLGGFVGLELPEWNWKVSAADDIETEELVVTGQCGDNAYWEFDASTGTLTISGTGSAWSGESAENSGIAPYVDYITSLVVEEGITELGMLQYYYPNLSDISLPNSLEVYFTTIFDYSAYCEDEKNWENDVLYVDDCFIKCREGGEGTLVVRDGTTRMPAFALGNSNYTDVILPKSMQKISTCAFAYQTQLRSVHFGGSVDKIGDAAFDMCISLETITGLESVKEIGIGAFGVCYKLKSIDLSKTERIGDMAFGGCFLLEEIDLSSAKEIGAQAFQMCVSLDKVILPTALNSLDKEAFSECLFLEEAYVYNPNMSFSENALCMSYATITDDIAKEDFASLIIDFYDKTFELLGSDDKSELDDLEAEIEKHMFEYETPQPYGTIVCYKGSTAETYAIENGINYRYFSNEEPQRTVVATGQCGDNAFYTLYSDGELVVSGEGEMWDYDKGDLEYHKGSIKTVVIENGIKSIGSHMFSFCDNLSSVNIADSVIAIRFSAFSYCENLANITFGDGIESIGEAAFYECDSIESLILGDNVESIGNSAFWNCSGLTNITVGKKVKTIGDFAFYGCYKLTSLNIPDSVTNIGSQAFSECTGLTNITVEVDNIAYCSDNTGVLFDKNKTILIKYPSKNTNTTYTIPNSVTTIGDGAFSGSNNLTNVTIPNSVIDIGAWTFNHSNKLTSVVIPNSVKTIGAGAFGYCDNLESITVGNGIETIDYQVLAYCPKLKSVTIGSSVTSISDFAFVGSDEIDNVYYIGTEEEWNNIYIGDYNEPLLNATIHFLGEEECDHNPIEQTIPATCTVNGMKFYICSECGDTVGETEIIPAAHTPGEWETVIAPTYEAEGKRIKKCTVCGETVEEETLPKLEKQLVEDEETGVGLEFPAENYDGKVEIEVEESFDGTAFNILDTKTGAVQQKIYDIKMLVDGEVTQPNGKITVRIPLPAGYNPKFSFVYYVNTETGAVEKMEATYEDGYMVFETDHFSYYAVIAEPDTDNCSCNCHKGGIKGFFFKFLLFFQKIFRTNKVCKCGINHY